MTNTLYDVSMAFAKILDESVEFKDLCIATLGKPFTYYVHVDMANVDGIDLPYFSFVTYTAKKQNGEREEVLVQMLAGIERTGVTNEGSIYTESTQLDLETVTKKAIELIVKEMSTFGVNGEKGFIQDYLNIYAPPPMGEEDIQLQIDMILNTETCLR